MHKAIKVAKFGGSSLANHTQIMKVYEIVVSDPTRKIVVVSAPGKEHKEDVKITDLLINCANIFLEKGRADEELNGIVMRYEKIAKGLGLSHEIVNTIEADLNFRISLSANNSKKFMDSMKAAGEDNNAKLIAYYLRSMGMNAYYINPKDAGLILTEEYGNARVLPQSFDRLKLLRDMEGTLVFPGFFGYSLDGDIVTFSRGGSDITGSILALAVEAEVYENFTDVDFVFSANPKIVPSARPISNITYREMRELSYAGFSVLHEDALQPTYKAGIPVHIKNTNNPLAHGTLVVPEYKRLESPVAGIASDVDFCCVYIHKYMMNREIGFVRKVLSILEKYAIPYDHIPSGIDDVSIFLRQKYFDSDIAIKFSEEIKEKLGVEEENGMGDIRIEWDICLITIVGEGMIDRIGVGYRAMKALADAQINVIMVSQGSSGISMILGVHKQDEVAAVSSIYREFMGDIIY